MNTLATPYEATSAQVVRWKFGPILLLIWLVAAVLLAFTFRDGLRELLHLWERKEEYSHAYLLPFISLFFFWQNKHQLSASPWLGAWLGTAVVLVGLLVFFVGALSTIYAVIHYALFITLAGLVLAHAGWRNMPHLWAGLVLLFFAVPFPQFLYQALSTKLQLLSSEFGVAVIRMFGVSVFLEGNVIDLGSYKLQVIEACNGLRYLFPLASFGFICAYLYRGPVWHKLLILVSTAPITVFMNSFRIGVIGVTVDRWGTEMAEGILHDFEGWAIFMACLGILFIEIAFLAKLQRPSRSFADTFYVEIPTGASDVGPVANQPVPRPFLVSLGLLAVAAAFTVAVSSRSEIIPQRSDFRDFPTQIGGWSGTRVPLEKMYIDALKFTDYVMVNYVKESRAQPVNFYVAYYESQRAGESAHSPRSCIPGGGWKIEDHSVRSLDLPALGRNELRVNRVQIAMGDNRQLVYYWFRQRGRVITNEYLVKWYLLLDAITRNRSDGALVRVTTSIPRGQDWEAGDRVLQDFIGTLGAQLDAYVPN